MVICNRMFLFCLRHHSHSVVHEGDVSVHERKSKKSYIDACCRIYDRTLEPIFTPVTTELRNRTETLVGITGWKTANYRPPWKQIILDPIRIVWRPHVLPVLIFEAAVFGFGIGINVRFIFYSMLLYLIPPIGN